MTEKQQQLTFNKGITNVPSDAVCDDGTLSVCEGMTAQNGELKPIQAPVMLEGTPTNSILCVHDGRYLYPSGSSILYKMGSSTGTVTSFSGTFKDITTIGNTVIVSTSVEMKYALWNGSEYIQLGSRIPEPNIQLQIYRGDVFQETISYDGMCSQDDDRILSGQQNAWNDNVYGAYYSLLRKAHIDKQFAQPFVAIVAVELYDGSYTLHSNPFIFLPWYSADLFWYKKSPRGDMSGQVFLKGAKLRFKGGANYTGWGDIVKNISIFVSREISVFNTSADATFTMYQKTIYVEDNPVLVHNQYGYQIECGYSLACDSLPLKNKITDIGDGGTYYGISLWTQGSNPGGSPYTDIYRLLHGLSNSEIAQMLSDESVFYKLCDIGLSTKQNWTMTTNYISSYTLENIEVQQQLPNADYHTHDSVIGDYLYLYNGRLNVSGIQRTLFNGFTNFFTWDITGSNTYSYTIDVYISTNSGDKRVRTTVNSTSEAIGQVYFFYPDPRATKVRFYTGSSYVERTLTEHPGLNGAYWFDGLPAYNSTNNGLAPVPSSSIFPNTGGAGDAPPAAIEYIPDTIMTSEVDNPFLFLSKGYVKIEAPVIGMAAVTMALSEYQHGHQPLIVFTEKGIWSLTLNSEGYYIATQAVSREVCNNASSITQVDYGIYFASNKGLMYLSTGGVKCVSEQMRGTDFDDFIDNCMIAYDYKDSLLHIYKASSPFSTTHYVYNMKSGTFSTQVESSSTTRVVNNYPDTITQKIVNGSLRAFSFYNKPDEQHDGTTSGSSFTPNYYSAQLITRPMKLENALALKSIMQVRHITAFNSDTWSETVNQVTTTRNTLSLHIYASNNMRTWVELHSLRGQPWKYYKFQYDFNHLVATDRFAGTVIVTQERRTDKLR